MVERVRSMRSWYFAALLLLPFSATEAMAQTAEGACTGMVDPQQRLDCYDNRFPPVAGAGRVLPGSAASEARGKEEFGLNKRQLNAGRPQGQREIDPDRIEGVIKSIGQRGDGQRVVTLENDQAWVLTESTSRGRMAAGDKVAIRKAAMGTFMLVTEGGVALRAKRLR